MASIPLAKERVTCVPCRCFGVCVCTEMMELEGNATRDNKEPYCAPPHRASAPPDKHGDRSFPFMYTAQHDATTADILPVTAVKTTLDYLRCNPDFSIDIFGINIESWQSSLLRTGVLWNKLHNSSIPLVFLEMRCAHILSN
jgi:hypothetical protein